MERIGILYGTSEGQTAKVAAHLGALLARHGYSVTLRHVAELPDDFSLDDLSAVFLGASVHEGRYQRYFTTFVQQHRDWLNSHPTAFFSVCLAAASRDPQERAEAEAIIDRFEADTGFRPTSRTPVAGALRYTQYSWLKRALMKHIAKKEGGDTDTSQDHEYTDWVALDAWAEAFLQTL